MLLPTSDPNPSHRSARKQNHSAEGLGTRSVPMSWSVPSRAGRGQGWAAHLHPKRYPLAAAFRASRRLRRSTLRAFASASVTRLACRRCATVV